jgi:uncharacterized membrane protein
MRFRITFQPALKLTLCLAFASSVGVLLLIARLVKSHQFAHFNLVWNLFLAWLPLGFAVLSTRAMNSRWQSLFCGFLWLLFLPNAPYLVTDLVHLKPRPAVPLWYDIMVMQLFVLIGLLLGFLSVRVMHCRVSARFGCRSGWLFTMAVLALAGFGIYLGRFERWNSWDVFVQPIDLVQGIADVLIHPRTGKVAIGFSVLSGVFLILGYSTLHALTAWQQSHPAPLAGNRR